MRIMIQDLERRVQLSAAVAAIPPVVQTFSYPTFDASASSPRDFYHATQDVTPVTGQVADVKVTLNEDIVPTRSPFGSDFWLQVFGASKDTLTFNATSTISLGDHSASASVAASEVTTTPDVPQWFYFSDTFAPVLHVQMSFTLTGAEAQAFTANGGNISLDHDGQTREQFSGSGNDQFNEQWDVFVENSVLTVQFDFVQPAAVRVAKPHGHVVSLAEAMGLTVQAYKTEFINN